METTLDKLKEYLKKERLSVVQFAKTTGIPQDRVYSWMRGKGNPKAEDQKKLDALFRNGTNTNSEEELPNVHEQPPQQPVDIIPDPQMPGIYQNIVLELIESSKAQRKISEALLEERQLIRDTAQAAIDLAKQATGPQAAPIKKELDELIVTVGHLEESVEDDHATLLGTQEYFLEQLAALVKSGNADLMRIDLGKKILVEMKRKGIVKGVGSQNTLIRS